jgi:hypothetical protein
LAIPGFEFGSFSSLAVNLGESLAASFFSRIVVHVLFSCMK